jgi:hypothetical protein
LLSDPSYNLRVAGVGAALRYRGRDTFNRQTALCYEKGTLIARLSGSSTADGDVPHLQNANGCALFRMSCGRAPTWSRVPVRREEMPFAQSGATAVARPYTLIAMQLNAAEYPAAKNGMKLPRIRRYTASA